MIVYDVKCQNGHVFTGWFRDSDSFDEQAASGGIACTECGEIRVSRAIMAPNLASSRRREAREEAAKTAAGQQQATVSSESAPEAPAQISAVHAEAALMQQLRGLRHAIEKNCENVGDRFPEEARKIHYGETEARGIYGEATERETRDLADEGIEIGRIPWVKQADN
jgi:hypothetical protein